MDIQRLVSVVKMAKVLEEYITEKQRSVVRFFCGEENSIQVIFIKKSFCLRWEVFVA
jgi:hypothetical protein